MLYFNSLSHTIIIKGSRWEFNRIVYSYTFNPMLRILLAKAWLHVDSKHMWDHLIDVSTRTMKYLNGPDNGCMGPHMSPWIHSRNLSGSTWILSDEGLKISFPITHEVQTKSFYFEILVSFKLWPVQFAIIFLIVPILQWPKHECQVLNVSTFWKITLYATCGMGLMYV
jgi:hypothetical protein